MPQPGEGPEPLGPQLRRLPSSLLVVASHWTPPALLTSGLTPSRDGEHPGDLGRDPGDEPRRGPGKAMPQSGAPRPAGGWAACRPRGGWRWGGCWSAPRVITTLDAKGRGVIGKTAVLLRGRLRRERSRTNAAGPRASSVKSPRCPAPAP